MKERPILMSAPMVRAILAGNLPLTSSLGYCTLAKTQTRRALRKQPEESFPKGYPGASRDRLHWYDNLLDKCPYGQPGDRLWVRETWAKSDEGVLAYRASESPLWVSKWKPSIFMRREYCRIVLEVVSVRVERLQEISEADAIAEGLTKLTKDGTLFKYGVPDRDGLPGTDNTGWEWQYWCESPVDAYCALWESINGKGSWDENPWVWVVEFQKH